MLVGLSHNVVVAVGVIAIATTVAVATAVAVIAVVDNGHDLFQSPFRSLNRTTHTRRRRRPLQQSLWGL
jgi:hypothetical protein